MLFMLFLLMYKSVAEAYLISVSASMQSSARVISLSQCIGAHWSANACNAISFSAHWSANACNPSLSAHQRTRAPCKPCWLRNSLRQALIGARLCRPFVVRRSSKLCVTQCLSSKISCILCIPANLGKFDSLGLWMAALPINSKGLGLSSGFVKGRRS